MRSHWGSDIVVGKGRVFHPAKLDGFAAFKGENPVGLLTYRIEASDYEVVTIDSTTEGEGIGTALINAVKEKGQSERLQKTLADNQQ